MDEVKKRLEKKQKKKRASEKLDKMDEHLQDCFSSLETPTMKDTLPYRISVWLFNQAIGLPGVILARLTKKKEEIDEDEELNAQIQSGKEYQKKKAQISKLHKELNPTKIEKSDIAAPVITYNQTKSSSSNENIHEEQKPDTSKEWTDKQKQDLIKVGGNNPKKKF